ncbi:hypothetical protein L2E82_20431 [Cichorium intybus]|uniref:Uncharacterized protein n=1 Tax=Cichorium intybus TaxID=13427 RepID=A0ACB9DTR7_CICIN|nr:hypothetical protein L2E82_20431 [Cichorium intybus]
MDRFNKGALVEVCSDGDGFQGAWFASTVTNQVSSGNCLIVYKSLRNDEDTKFLTEVVNSNHIRPHPVREVVNHFCVLEEVDALYNDGWDDQRERICEEREPEDSNDDGDILDAEVGVVLSDPVCGVGYGVKFGEI